MHVCDNPPCENSIEKILNEMPFEEPIPYMIIIIDNILNDNVSESDDSSDEDIIASHDNAMEDSINIIDGIFQNEEEKHEDVDFEKLNDEEVNVDSHKEKKETLKKNLKRIPS